MEIDKMHNSTAFEEYNSGFSKMFWLDALFSGSKHNRRAMELLARSQDMIQNTQTTRKLGGVYKIIYEVETRKSWTTQLQK